MTARTTAAQMAAMTALYAPTPTPAELSHGLAELGDALAGQLAGLEALPDPVRCESVARNLDAAARLVLRLRQSIVEGE